MAQDPIATRIFDEMFKAGDEVVVITDEDDFLWGKMYRAIDHLRLKQLDGSVRNLWWDQVRFMAHDGFPVRQLMGTEARTAQMVIDAKVLRTASVVEFSKTHSIGYCYECGAALARDTAELSVLRKAGHRHAKLGTAYRDGDWRCSACEAKEKRLEELERKREARGPRVWMGGDPWIIEAFTRFIPGGSGQAHCDWDYFGDHEEALVLNHQNGAKGMLWELETVIEAA